MQEVDSGLRIQASWKISYSVIHSFWNVIHTVFCMPNAEVNHVIPCLSIMQKSRGLHQASDFDLVFEFNCNSSWQINLVIIKGHTDFFPVCF